MSTKVKTTVRVLVFTSPAHDLVAARGTFSPTTSTLLVGQSESVLVDAIHRRRHHGAGRPRREDSHQANDHLAGRMSPPHAHR
jgi:hypothetical protein